MSKSYLSFVLMMFLVCSSSAIAASGEWSKFMDSRVLNFDFVAPIVADDTVPPKQAGLIFFNSEKSKFQGFDLSGNAVEISSPASAASHTYSAYVSNGSGGSCGSGGTCVTSLEYGGDWISSVTKSGTTGLMTINLNTSVTGSGQLNCTATAKNTSASDDCYALEYTSNTSIDVWGLSCNAGAASDSRLEFSVICQGE